MGPVLSHVISKKHERQNQKSYLESAALLCIAKATAKADPAMIEHCITVLKNANYRPNVFNKHGMTLLHRAAESGDVLSLRIMIFAGESVNIVSKKNKYTPLMYATLSDKTECVKLLLENGANPDICDEWGNSPLSKSAAYNQEEIIRLLLEYHANPFISNKWGATPVLNAIQARHEEVAKTLLELNPDISQYDRKDSKAPQLLAKASEYHIPEVVTLLLAKGAQVNHCSDNDGETALFYCLKSTYYTMHSVLDYERVIEILLAAGAEVTTACVQFLGSVHGRETILKNLCYQSNLHHADILRVARREMTELFGTLYEYGFELEKGEAERNRICPEVINKLISSPRTLQSACKVKIRSLLKPNVSVCVDKLPLPEYLRKYIFF